jgi:hypothetical protein
MNKLVSDNIDQNLETLFSDERFSKIREKLREPNIFCFLSNANYEIRHSNFLAWLLDANETHNCGTLFSSIIIPILSPDIKNKKIAWEVFREKDNIDLLLKSPDEVVVIENKTLSRDSPGQLASYRKHINEKYPNIEKRFVYLTLDSKNPNDKNESEDWKNCGYASILEGLNNIIRTDGKSINAKAKIYIKDYIDALEMHTLKNSKYNIYAKEIVSENKNALMDIFSSAGNNPNIKHDQSVAIKFIENNSSYSRGEGFFKSTNMFYGAFRESLIKNNLEFSESSQNTTYLRFRSRAWKKNMPVDMGFRYNKERKRLDFGVAILPENEANRLTRENLKNNIKLIQQEFGENAGAAKGKMHIGVFSKKIPFDLLLYNEDNVVDKINEFIRKHVLDDVKHIEKIIEKYSC